MSTEVASMHANISVYMQQAITALGMVKKHFDDAGGAAERMEQKVKKSDSTLKMMGDLISKVNQPIFFLKENLETLARVATETFQALKAGATGIELRGAFASQIEDTGVALDSYLAKLRNASGGTVSDMDLMSSASKAMSLGVTQDVNQMADLLEIARFKARKFGTDVNVAFEDISIGVGRQSKLILDNLGIVVDTDQAYAAYAASIGKTASALTDMEKKQAFLNAVLREGQQEIANAGGIMDSQADKFRQIEAAAGDATLAIQGYLATQVGFAGSAEGLRDVAEYFREATAEAEKLTAVKAILDEMGQGDLGGRRDLDQLLKVDESGAGGTGLRAWLEGRDALDEYVASLEKARDAGAITEQQFYQLAYGVDNASALIYKNMFAVDGATASALALQDAQHQLRNTTTSVGDEMQAAGGVGTVFGNILHFVGDASDAAAGGISRANAILGAFMGTMSNAIGIAGALGGALNRLASARAAQSPQNALEVAQWELQNAQNAMSSSTSLTGRINAFAGITEAENKVADAQGNVRAELEKTKEAYRSSKEEEIRLGEQAASAAETASNKAAREAERAAEETARAWERAVDEVRGAVSRGIDLSIKVGANDEILRAMGLQGEAVNEAGRRLQDVVNRGIESPWVEAFAELRGKTNDEVKATAAYMQSQIDQFLRPDLLNKEAILDNARNALIGGRNRAALIEEITNQLVAEGYAVVEAKRTIAEQLGESVPTEGAEGGTAMVDAVIQSTRDTLASKEEELYNLGRATAKPYLKGILDETLESDLPNAIAQMVFGLMQTQARATS